MIPQFLFCAAQVLGAQVPGAQTLATPAPPHARPLPQVPQVRVPPQPSGIVPQFLCAAVQVVGAQLLTFGAAQTLATPAPPQVSPDLHPPQLSSPPQPSFIVPQFL